MTKTIFLALIVIGLAGCSQPDPAWYSAPEQYTCTMEQAKQVDYETRTCESTGAWGYFGSYCYGTALMRNCSKVIGGQKIPKESSHD